jgi:competence protein ComEC
VTLRAVGPGLVLAAVLAGIAAGFRAGPGAARAPLVVAIIATALALSARGGVGIALVCVAAACAGAAFTGRALNGLEHSPLTRAVAARASATIDVTLVDDPKATRWSARALGRVATVRSPRHARSDGGGRTVVIDATGDGAARLAVLQAGDRARLVGYFRPLDPYEARFRWRHAVGAFAANDLTAFRGSSSPVMAVANALRARVLAGHRAVPEPQRALIAGFLLGDTSDVPSDLVEDFRAAGLTHLVAVSGENVGE